MFQVAEYRTCGQVIGLNGLMWSRIGYVFITLLPPLGLHLVSAIAQRKPFWLHWAADVLAALLVALFALAPSSLNSAVCGGNYVIFKLHAGLGFIYGLYYLGFLFAGLILAAKYMHRAKKVHYDALFWMIIGYLVFLIPTGIINMFNPVTTQGVPSIMCGFAVFYAIVLVVKVLPGSAEKR